MFSILLLLLSQFSAVSGATKEEGVIRLDYHGLRQRPRSRNTGSNPSGGGRKEEGVIRSDYHESLRQRPKNTTSNPSGGSEADSKFLILSTVDEQGSLRIGRFPTAVPQSQDTGDGEVEWTEVEQGIVDSELSAAGMLWVVSKKKLYKMRPFSDLDLQVVTGPTLKSKETFKLVTVDADNKVWVVTSSERIFSNYPGYWKHIRIINDECQSVYDVSISPSDGTPWIICNRLCVRWKKDAGYWGMVYTIPGGVEEGRYLSVVDKNNILISMSSGLIKRQSFLPGAASWVRRDAGDTAYLSSSQSVFKLSVDGTKLIEYQNYDNKVWETRLSFKVARLSVGQGVRQKEPKVTEPKVTEPKVTEPQATPVPTDAPTEASQRVQQGRFVTRYSTTLHNL